MLPKTPPKKKPPSRSFPSDITSVGGVDPKGVSQGVGDVPDWQRLDSWMDEGIGLVREV